jgi:hypothetical protein
LDFFKLLRSLDELLFEILTWIIYYPRTLWMVVRRPLRMIDYSNHEQVDKEEEQYTDTLSPPLLLLITLVFAHVIEVNVHREVIKAGSDMARAIVSSDQNVIALRAFVFGLLPLFTAAAYVKRKKLPLERKYLRPPFFAECYVVAVFVIFIAATSTISGLYPQAAHIVMPLGYAVAAGWYLTVETLQLRRTLGLDTGAAVAQAVWVMAKALFLAILVALALAGGIS